METHEGFITIIDGNIMRVSRYIYRGWSAPYNKQAYSNKGREWTSKPILKAHYSSN